MLDALIKNNFTVIVVFNDNQKVDAWISSFKQFKCVLIQRPNIGRDFGAYQSGLNFLLENLEKREIKRLVFVNDSCYVSPKCQERFLDIFLAQNEVNCVTKHFRGVVHASSSLLNLSIQNIDSVKFFKFWKRYYQHIIRFKVVFKGEHKLSKIIGQSRLIPATDVLRGDEHRLNFFELAQLRASIQHTNSNFSPSLDDLLSQSPFSQLKHNINFVLDSLQVNNSLGLYLARRYSFPIKIDLPYYRLITKDTFVSHLRDDGCTPDELLEVWQILDAKMNISVGNTFQLTLRSLGLNI